MDTFQPPPPILPDLVTSPTSTNGLTTINDNCSSGFQSTNLSPWPPATPCSSSSFTTCTTTNFNDYTPVCVLPPPPSPPQQAPIQVAHQISQPAQLPDIPTNQLILEFEKILKDDKDPVVLTNSFCLLFRYSIDYYRGLEICQAMSASHTILDRIYFALTEEQFKDDDLILCYATGNLTNISKCDAGRAAILDSDEARNFSQYQDSPSMGVISLFHSLQATDSNVVIFAITAIHNLLLDRREDKQGIAKQQIRHGLGYIVKLLDNESLKNNYEFKVIVLDCLQILAYGNSDNRRTIKESGGPFLLLKTIEENLYNQHADELIETALRVLRSLSACHDNKIEIIKYGGINVLTECIKKDNHEILKICLWTLRNLSDVIINSRLVATNCIENLAKKLLDILDCYRKRMLQYQQEPCIPPCIVTCALGVLANLTCNNESIKQFICAENGISLLLDSIAIAPGFARDGYDSRAVEEILEPAVCALCHLMNQNRNLTHEAMMIRENINIPADFMTYEIDKAVKKLGKLTGDVVGI